MGGLGRVNRVVGQNGSRVKRVIFKWVNRITGQVASQVELTRIFQTIFFFFEIDAIYQLFMSSLIVIRFSPVILLILTNYH